ncbi:hypothetical protein PC41400_21695 [Paenibacillus chitinolyticus]|uniref:Uncharacterized protein n=2 Tax=Paenibacillus chitinolyticus TaxID=79263 RepID=A0A410X0C2_9BACL|nr:hypothetical protein PC41400_21695 [Paenibacillus chitinolyticus]
MLLLVSGATQTVKRVSGDSDNIGGLLTPRAGNLSYYTTSGIPWAADNDCFNGFDENRFMSMLDRMRGSNPTFVTAPDIVGDAMGTLDMFLHWEPVIHSYGLPIAFVLQDGQEKLCMPWGKLDAVFIGGSTDYKLGPEIRWLVREAKWRGKWVHMGRVNSLQRLSYARDIGCDSVDGTGYSRFPDANIPEALNFLKHEQITLNIDEAL